MFIDLITDKGEEFFVNLNHVVYAGANKKGSFIVLSDGSDYFLKCTYEELKSRLKFFTDTGYVDNITKD